MKNWIKIVIVSVILVGFTFAFKGLTKGPEGTNGTYTLSYDVNAWTLRQKWMNVGSINDSTVVRASNSYFRKIAPLSEILTPYATTSSVNTLLGGYAQKNGTPSQYIKGDGTFGTYGSGFITSESDPVWSGVSSTYRTKTQNDALYYPISGNPSGFLTSETDPQFNTKFGSKTTTDLIEGLNQYFTTARARAAFTAGTGIDLTGGTITNTLPDPGRIVNNATIGLSKATLNSTYPNVPVGYNVMCPSILLGGAIYVKATENGSNDVWQTISAPPTL